ncbi:cob(I)yrinic acid a,c-diamide adenosyltransferase [Carnobacterium sp. TMP28]|uniref:cob(I)yrinic acid a,c-diamide adenosyltransferase n=1 Tax=Carnobacterium sp. TMP28 TaxID=3397060 RepID=UPI0039E14AF1
MQIYTKRGDYGNTNLIGGRTISKDAIRVESYGTLDELNSLVGVIISQMTEEELVLKKELAEIQLLLFDCGTDLATLEGTRDYLITKEAVEWLESRIDDYSTEPPTIEKFVLPGGDPVASFLHLARTVTRRAERIIVSLGKTEKINRVVMIFINRLSDYFFSLARVVNSRKKIKEPFYEKGGKVFHSELKKETIPKTHY